MKTIIFLAMLCCSAFSQDADRKEPVEQCSIIRDSDWGVVGQAVNNFLKQDIVVIRVLQSESTAYNPNTRSMTTMLTITIFWRKKEN